MAAVVFDTGALIALDRGSREVGALLHEAAAAGLDAVTSSACVAEAWRDPARQARLLRALDGMVEHPLDPSAARGCGALLAGAGTADIADAAIALVAGPNDTILTSDHADISHLVAVAGAGARVRAV